MLGFGDLGVALAYILCILSTVLCVVYGIIHYNDDEELPPIIHPKDENTDLDEEV